MSLTFKSSVFLILAFAISWSTVALGWFFGGASSPQIAVGAMAAMMLGPSIAALLCALWFDRGRRREALGLRWTPSWWWLGAWAIAIGIAVGASWITIAAGQANYVDPGQNYLARLREAAPEQAAQLELLPVTWILIGQSAILNALINTPLMVISEELGWRGYLHSLWRRFGFVRCSVATGFFWGVWHAPAIYLFGLNYPDNRLIGIPLFVGFCVLFSFPLTLVRDRGKSVWAPAILHGTSNAVGGVSMLALSNAAFPWSGVVGVGGFIMLAIMAGAAWALGARWGAHSRDGPLSS